MEHDAFRYDFTMKELAYFLFDKKECPKCGKKMDKYKEYETVPGSTFNTKSEVFHNTKVKHYLYVYKCRQCGSQYTLKELAK